MRREALKAFLFATAVFIFGIYIGNHIAKQEILNIFNRITEIEGLLFSAMIYEYVSEKDIYMLGKELDKIGIYINSLESSDFADKRKIKLLKIYYFNLEYLHYKIVKKICRDCKAIIYFYGPKCKNCDIFSEVLVRIKQKDPSKIYVYSFDITYPNLFIKGLKEKYNLTKYPCIIYNGLVYYDIEEFSSIFLS